MSGTQTAGWKHKVELAEQLKAVVTFSRIALDGSSAIPESPDRT